MPNLESNIAIVILAAGESKRMGTPKQLLKWGDTSLLGHAINNTLKVNTNVFVVLGAHFNLIEKSIENSPVTILNNKNWKDGLGRSIGFSANYIAELKSGVEGVLFMLADQPFIDAPYLIQMLLEFKAGEQSIIATSYEKDKQGVPVIFDKVYFKELSKLNDDNGAKHILKKYKSNTKALEPLKKNVDIDTIEDYKTIK